MDGGSSRGVGVSYAQDGKIQKQIRIEDNLGLYNDLGQVRIAGDNGRMISQLLILTGI